MKREGGADTKVIADGLPVAEALCGALEEATSAELGPVAARHHALQHVADERSNNQQAGALLGLLLRRLPRRNVVLQGSILHPGEYGAQHLVQCGLQCSKNYETLFCMYPIELQIVL